MDIPVPEQDSIPAVVSASSVVQHTVDRAQIKALTADAALTIPGECRHCARRVVHAFGLKWFGELWSLDRLLAAIDSADHVGWVDDCGGYDLMVTLAGVTYRFQVKRPVQEVAA